MSGQTEQGDKTEFTMVAHGSPGLSHRSFSLVGCPGLGGHS